ncbi:MAG: efflux RND transporter permease subunit [Chitinophagales bacterium]
MLNHFIKFSLQNRLLISAAAIILLVYGFYSAVHLPVDVLPDLNKPQVVVFLEAEGMAPEEVEQLVTLPVERTMNGAPGVEAVRSNSTIGLGMVFVTFAYGTDVLKDRQIVAEKLQLAQAQLPEGVIPAMGPISSIMGQIMLIGMSSDTTSKADLRTLADYTIRPRLLSVPGVAQVIPIGGEVLQYQVLLDPIRMNTSGISVDEVENALRNSNSNSTGNFYVRNGQEILIRNLGRITSLDDIKNLVIGERNNTPVLVQNIAEVSFGAKQKRGDASVNGRPAVILAVEKQPGVNTSDLTEKITEAVSDLQKQVPEDVKINPDVFQQKHFIENSISNVLAALLDGSILVIIILFIFLFNLRTTVISLTAIPLSIAITAIIFSQFGLSVNTMTLGGLAIAIGELVDDAIIDVENVFRRLKENRQSASPRSPLLVIYEASAEVRNSIVYATVIVVLVFIPLFFLGGVEGRIFSPLGIAYITSILSSLLVSLTVTPVMCYYLLSKGKLLESKDTVVVQWLKKWDVKMLTRGLQKPKAVLGGVSMLFVIAIIMFLSFGSEFLPEFNEGSLTVNMFARPGIALAESNKLGTIAEQQIMKVPEVKYTARRTGRAELDEHAEGVHSTEIEVELDYSKLNRKKEVVVNEIRNKLDAMKGVVVVVGQPISHRLEHLLSGVQAQVAIRLYGSDLSMLRNFADQIKNSIQNVKGVSDLKVEQQVLIPQLNIKVDDGKILKYGLQKGDIVKDLQTLFQGESVSQIIDGQKRFDLVVRLSEDARRDLSLIQNTLISLPSGEMIPIKNIAEISEEPGPNTISHVNAQREITVSLNASGRDLAGMVREVKDKIAAGVKLPSGYFIEYGGQYESQQAASRLILILSIVVLIVIALVLYSHFKSFLLVMQIMLNIPLALIGSVIAIWLTGGVTSIATMVGFVTLTGIASRNGIMRVSHYIHLIKYEGEKFNEQLIIRGSLERLVPVMMTALVAALGLLPLLFNPGEPGKEILYPVAAVILGGLISSTLLDLIVSPIVFSLIGKKALETYFSQTENDPLEKAAT